MSFSLTATLRSKTTIVQYNNNHVDKRQGTIVQRRSAHHLRPTTRMGEKQPLYPHRLPTHFPFLPRLPSQLDFRAQRKHEYLLAPPSRLSSSLTPPPRRSRSDGQSRISNRAADGRYPGLRRLLPRCPSVYGFLSRLPHADEPLTSGGGLNQAI